MTVLMREEISASPVATPIQFSETCSLTAVKYKGTIAGTQKPKEKEKTAIV